MTAVTGAQYNTECDSKCLHSVSEICCNCTKHGKTIVPINWYVFFTLMYEKYRKSKTNK